jgi:hypothetical protein
VKRDGPVMGFDDNLLKEMDRIIERYGNIRDELAV